MSEELSPEEIKAIHKLGLFKIKGRDKRGRKILRIIGKNFPAKSLSVDLLKKYLEVKVFPKLERPFVVVYIHTDVHKAKISPEYPLSDLPTMQFRSTSNNIWRRFYFVHPDLQSRLFLATFGRFIFTGGLYAKLKYVSRLGYLWDHVRRNEIEIPEFVYDHDEDLEYRPMMDYGLESDHPRVFGAPAVDSSVATYSMRCIS